MFTKKELTFLYQLLDQVNLRGIEQKRMGLMLMIKLTAKIKELESKMAKPSTEDGPVK